MQNTTAILSLKEVTDSQDYSVDKKTGASVRIIRKQTRREETDSDSKTANLKVCQLDPTDQKGNEFFEDMINRYHYIGMAKHHAGEIRYLVYANNVWVAALSFGSAAWMCADRDAWIGWDSEIRANKLQKIVNNTRFLMNPKITRKYLASQVLSLATKRIRADWLERYRKDIVLLETFVDEQYDGVCYKASNWIYVGKTKGRGKWDTHHEKEVSIKKIFVYPLVAKAHTELDGKKPAKIVKGWEEEEFESFKSSDKRLQKRLHTISRDFYANPNANIPEACKSRAKTKATYRFFNHQDATIETVLQAHYETTIKRLHKQRIVLAVQDSTSLNYSTHDNPELGTLSNSAKKEGVMVHDTLAFTEEGVPLGLLDLQTWERNPKDFGERVKRKATPIEDKESYKWLKSYKALISIQQKLKDTKIISVGDREADIFELFELAKQTPNAPEILVRAKNNRTLLTKGIKLWESLESEPVSGVIIIEVPRKPGQKKRQAELSISYKSVTIIHPKQKGSLNIWAVYVRELNPPTGIDPISWMLLTTLEVSTLKEALEKVNWYIIRWQIEIYHKIIKSGCKTEQRQFETLKSLKTCLAIDLVIAWRIFYMTKLSRNNEDILCNVCLEEHEWKALYCYHKRTLVLPTTPPTLKEAVKMIAELGGFLGRKSDGNPGPITIWRGLITLATIIQCYKMFNPP